MISRKRKSFEVTVALQSFHSFILFGCRVLLVRVPERERDERDERDERLLCVAASLER